MRSLSTRTFLLVAGAVLLSGAVTVAVAALFTRSRLDDQVDRNFERQVAGLAVALSVREGPGPHVFYLDQAGLVPLPVGGEVPDGLAPVRDAVVAELRAGQPSTSLDTPAGRVLLAVRQTPDGPVALARSAALRPRDWRPLWGGVVISALIGVAIAWLAALALARRLAGPLRQLSRASAEIAAGDLSARVPVRGSDELARVGRSFNSMVDEVARSRERERELILAVSHDFRTPLTSVQGYAEALEEGAVEPNVAAEAIGAEARRLDRLVSDLLDLGRSQQGSLSFDLRPIDLAVVAEELRVRFAPAAARFGVELRVRSDEAGWVVADADRLAQVGANLVENALRATPSGGSVAITARATRLEVSDTGPGIAAEDQDRAFERFYLHARYRGREEVGVGLGLAIVKELTEAMGGRVWLESVPGGGATFRVELPAAELQGDGRGAGAEATAREPR